MIVVQKMWEGQNMCVGLKLCHEQPEGDQKMTWHQQLLFIYVTVVEIHN